MQYSPKELLHTAYLHCWGVILMKRKVRLGVGLMSSSAVVALLTASPAMAQTAAPETNASGQKDPLVLEEVIISSDRQNSYSADLVQAGSFHGAKQLDTPLTVNVIPQEVLQSQQVSDLLGALKNTAGVSDSQVSPVIYSNLAIRGITVNNTGNYRLNGSLPIVNMITMPVEAFERVEALKGASALYYGFTTPSGIVNLTMKRPTTDTFIEVDQIDDSHGSVGAHTDVSGTYGMFGFRVNALDQIVNDGTTYVSGHRSYITGAFDIKPTNDLTLSVDAIHNEQHLVEPAAVKLVAPASTLTNYYPTVALPPLLDPKVNLGPAWGYNVTQEDNILLHAGYKISNTWTASADFGVSNLTRNRDFSYFTPTNLVTGAGTIGVNENNQRYENTNFRVEMAGAFYTGPIVHEVLFGVSENLRDTVGPTIATTNTCNGIVGCPQNYFNPVSIPQNVFSVNQASFATQRIFDLGEYVFDHIKYDDWLQFLVGVRNAEYHQYTLGTTASSVHTYPISYSYGAVVKPLSWISLYADYMQGLETTAAGPQTTTNPGVQLPPAESEQREAGAKIEITPGLLFQGAYFDINRAAAYTNGQNTWVLDGRQRYRGGEVSLTGEVTKDLSVYLSAQDLDAVQISGAPTIITVSKGVTTVAPTIVGKVPDGTPQVTWSLAGEYRLTQFVPGLAFTFGAYYVDKRAVNAANQNWAPAYTTFDMGGSYVANIYDHPVTFRINANNITDARYWVGTSGLYLSESVPATVKFSISSVF